MTSPQVSVTDLLERNKKVSTTHTPYPKVADASFRTPHIVIVTCADPRCIPEYMLNLEVGDAVIFRTVAGRVDPVIKDIVALDEFIGMTECMIIHHTDCGATFWTDNDIREKMRKRLPDLEGIEEMKFGAIADMKESLREDLAVFSASPLVRKELADKTYGFVFDVETGRLERVDK